MYKSNTLTMLYLIEKFTFGLRYYYNYAHAHDKTRARALYVIAGRVNAYGVVPATQA